MSDMFFPVHYQRNDSKGATTVSWKMTKNNLQYSLGVFYGVIACFALSPVAFSVISKEHPWP